jgi:hypothetical protein
MTRPVLDGKLMFPSEYLAAEEFDGKDITLTIKDARFDDLRTVDGGTKRKPLLYFGETDKKLVLNKTNATTIAKLHGAEAREWAGKRITLYATECQAFGKTVECIRVRAKIPKPKAGDANESKSTSGDKFEHAVIPNTMGREKPEVRGPQEKSGAAEGSTAKETAPDVQAIKSMYKSFITLSREPALKNGLRAMVDASSYDEKSDPAGVVAEAKERHWQQAGENLMRYFGWL